MTTDKALTVLRAITYKPNFKFRFAVERGRLLSGISIRITYTRRDSDDESLATSQLTQFMGTEPLAAIDEHHLLHWFKTILMDIEHHELQEWFRCRGVRVEAPHIPTPK